MQYYLGQHPEIFMLPQPEPHFFGSDVRLSWFPRLTRETYLELFSGAKGEKLVGEKSTSYLSSRLAAAEIKAFSPDAYIIAMLRNPVDMIYSLHSELLFMGVETIPDFHEAITTENERSASVYSGTSGASQVSARVYREAVQYAEQVQRFFDVFGREKVLVVLFDDFRRDTAGVYADTLRYLNVDAEFQPDFVVVNANKRLRSAWLRRPPKLAVQMSRILLPKPVRHKLRRGIENVNKVDESRRPMDPALRKSLQAQFAPEVQELGKLIERDLTHWLS